MAGKRKRARDMKRPSRNFPGVRSVIDAGGWVPHVLCDVSGAYWSGRTAIDANGTFQDGLSDAFRKELLSMVLDGTFGEELKDVWVDHEQYWRIRDELLTWPNPDAIATKGLGVLKMRRGDGLRGTMQTDTSIVPDQSS